MISGSHFTKGNMGSFHLCYCYVSSQMVAFEISGLVGTYYGQLYIRQWGEIRAPAPKNRPYRAQEHDGEDPGARRWSPLPNQVGKDQGEYAM